MNNNSHLVNIKHVVNRRLDAMLLSLSCLLHTVNCSVNFFCMNMCLCDFWQSIVQYWMKKMWFLCPLFYQVLQKHPSKFWWENMWLFGFTNLRVIFLPRLLKSTMLAQTTAETMRNPVCEMQIIRVCRCVLQWRVKSMSVLRRWPRSTASSQRWLRSVKNWTTKSDCGATWISSGTT